MNIKISTNIHEYPRIFTNIHDIHKASGRRFSLMIVFWLTLWKLVSESVEIEFGARNHAGETSQESYPLRNRLSHKYP